MILKGEMVTRPSDHNYGVVWDGCLEATNMGLEIYKFCKYYHLPSDFSSKFQSTTTIIHYKFVRMQIIPNMREFYLRVEAEPREEQPTREGRVLTNR